MVEMIAELCRFTASKKCLKNDLLVVLGRLFIRKHLSTVLSSVLDYFQKYLFPLEHFLGEYLESNQEQLGPEPT